MLKRKTSPGASVQGSHPLKGAKGGAPSVVAIQSRKRWASPPEGLDDLIIRIGRMIAYQEYNSKSPLNGLAAKWAAQNSHLLPVDSRPIAPPLKSDEAVAAATEPVQVQVPGSADVPFAASDPWSEKIVISSDS